MKTDIMFTLTGRIYCNGGSSSSRGGGGGGGRVHAFFQHGDYISGYIEAKGTLHFAVNVVKVMWHTLSNNVVAVVVCLYL